MRKHRGRRAAIALLMGLVAAACGDASDDGATATTAGEVTTTTEVDAQAAACAAQVPLKSPDMVTIGLGIPGFELDTIRGESAQAVARELEIDAEFIEAAEDTPDAVVAAGPKDYDMGVPDRPISAESAEAVDVSDTYYAADYVAMAPPGSPFADSESLADLRDARVTTGLDAPPEIQSYIDDVIAPTTPTDPILGVPKSAELTRVGADVAIVTSDVALPFAGLEDLEPFALLPPSAEYPYELAMSFEKGNELSSCVNLALASLEADGTLAALEDEWVGELDSLPRLSE